MDFERWKHEASAILAQWHAIPPTQIAEAEWRRCYQAGDEPWRAADWLASQTLTGRLCEHN